MLVRVKDARLERVARQAMRLAHGLGLGLGIEETDHEDARWQVAWKVEKFNTPLKRGLIVPEGYVNGVFRPDLINATPQAVISGEGNLLVTSGISALWSSLTGLASVTAFSNANAMIGVGNGTTAASVGQTDLQGASKLRKAMSATFPSLSGAVLTFKSQFITSEANYAWEEWAVFNVSGSAAALPAAMLNRRVVSLGTKTSSATWDLTCSITLS